MTAAAIPAAGEGRATLRPPAPRRCRARFLVAGLGNLLLMDDGVGVHAVRELQCRGLRGAQVVEVGTAVLDALHLFERANRVLAIDAMQAGGVPGTIYRFGLDDVEKRHSRGSLHEVSLVGALEMIHGRPRPEVTVLGVEPARIDFGLDLTSAVEGVLPRLLEEVERIVADWNEATA